MTGYKNDGANNSNRATTQLIKLHRPNTSDVCVCVVWLHVKGMNGLVLPLCWISTQCVLWTGVLHYTIYDDNENLSETQLSAAFCSF